MKKTAYIKSDVEEEIKEEYVSNCKFRDACKIEIDGRLTPGCVQFESIDVKSEPFETVRPTASCLVVKDEVYRYTEIKTDIKDAYSQIATEVNSINTVKDIKCEEIDIKCDSMEEIRLSSTENGETMLINCNSPRDVTKSSGMLKHKDLNLVDHETTRENDADANVSENLLISGIPMYKCNNCPHKTCQISNLQNHVLTHMFSSKTGKYECNTCTFKTKWKGSLKTHLLVHTDPSKTPIYECNNCRFKAQRKTYLQQHMLKHMDLSKTETYECNTCPYKTQRKIYLKRHMAVHADPSEITMFACDTCRYKSRRKHDLKIHMIVHEKDLSNIPMHECNSCLYKTRFKGSLKKHLLIHKKKNVQV